MNIIVALLIFSVIVSIHEFGHFIFAKLNDIEVLEYSIGMGPRILKYQGKETLYSIKLLPLGGSCRMLGEDDLEETHDKDRMKRSFGAKSVWARFMVVFAGPLFNFILAFIVSIFVIANTGVDKAIVADTMQGFPASIAGIKAGDEIIKVNGTNIVILRDYILYNTTHNVDEYELEVKRVENGELKKFSYILKPSLDKESGRKLVGISWDTKPVKEKSFISLLKYSIYELYFNIKSTLAGLKAMITGFIGIDQISGPVGIVNFVGETINESKSYGLKVVLLSVANLIILLSANLGVMNLLPIPALDGGRIVFFLYEMLTKRQANKKVEAYVHIAGFVLLMLFMVFIISNDILKIINR